MSSYQLGNCLLYCIFKQYSIEKACLLMNLQSKPSYAHNSTWTSHCNSVLISVGKIELLPPQHDMVRVRSFQRVNKSHCVYG